MSTTRHPLNNTYNRQALTCGLTHAVVVATTGEALARFGDEGSALDWLDETNWCEFHEGVILVVDIAAAVAA